MGSLPIWLVRPEALSMRARWKEFALQPCDGLDERLAAIFQGAEIWRPRQDLNLRPAA